MSEKRLGSKQEVGWVQPSDEQVREAALGLIALVEAELPQRFYRERLWRTWCATLIGSFHG